MEKRCQEEEEGDDPSPLPSTGGTTPGALCPALGHPYTDILDKAQHRPTNEQGSAAQITGGKADSAGNTQPTEEKIQGESHQWAQIPEKHMLKYRVRLSSVVHCNRTRGDGHRLKHRFHLNIKKDFFQGSEREVVQGGCGVET